jgi:site-specific recombinase XerD
MPGEAYQRAVDLAPVRGERLPAGRALTAGELTALFTSCAAARPGDLRDAAALAVLYGGGLRRAEAVALEIADYAPADCALRVRAGKGGKQRIAYLAAGGRVALDRWLNVRGQEPGALLCPVTRGGRISVRPLSGQALAALLARRATRASVPAFTAHDLRRTFTGDLLDRGADLAAVQRLAGHANPATTSRYDRRPEAAKRRAAELLHIPVSG